MIWLGAEYVVTQCTTAAIGDPCGIVKERVEFFKATLQTPQLGKDAQEQKEGCRLF